MFIFAASIFSSMESREELKARARIEEDNLRFCVRYGYMFSQAELEKRVNFHLDRLIPIYRQLKG